jgi:protein CpxP
VLFWQRYFSDITSGATMVKHSFLPLLLVFGMLAAYGHARPLLWQDQSTTQDNNSSQQSDTAQPSNPSQENIGSEANPVQGNTAQQGEHQGHRRHGNWGGPPSADKRLGMLTKQLNLTADQQSKVKPILEDQQKQFEALRQDSSVSPQDRHSKMAELQQSTSTQIRSVLTEDQQKRFDEMQQKRRKRMNKRMGGGTDQPNH